MMSHSLALSSEFIPKPPHHKLLLNYDGNNDGGNRYFQLQQRTNPNHTLKKKNRTEKQTNYQRTFFPFPKPRSSPSSKDPMKRLRKKSLEERKKRKRKRESYFI
jgi:hypothetical protein